MGSSTSSPSVTSSNDSSTTSTTTTTRVRGEADENGETYQAPPQTDFNQNHLPSSSPHVPRRSTSTSSTSSSSSPSSPLLYQSPNFFGPVMASPLLHHQIVFLSSPASASFSASSSPLPSSSPNPVSFLSHLSSQERGRSTPSPPLPPLPPLPATPPLTRRPSETTSLNSPGDLGNESGSDLDILGVGNRSYASFGTPGGGLGGGGQYRNSASSFYPSSLATGSFSSPFLLSESLSELPIRSDFPDEWFGAGFKGKGEGGEPQPPPSSLPPKDTESTVKWKTIYLACCYCICYIAYNTAQGLLTNLFPELGLETLAILYVCFATSSWIAPVYVKRVGRKQTMILGGASIATFLFSSIFNIPWLFLLMSAVCGFTSGPLWVAQGIYMSRITQMFPLSVGKLNGIFLSIYFTNGIVGNSVVATYLLSSRDIKDSTTTILYILFGIGLLGTILFCFVPNPPRSLLMKRSKETTLQRFMETWKIGKDKRMIFMLPYLFYGGFGSAFTWGGVPVILKQTDSRLVLVPFSFICYSLALITGAFTMGRLYDRLGWKPLMSLNLLLACLVYTVIPFAQKNEWTWLFFICFFLLGLMETVNSTMIQSTLLRHFPVNSAPAFSLYRFVEKVGGGTCFLLMRFLSYQVIEAIIGAFICLSFLSYAWYFTFIVPRSDDENLGTSGRKEGEGEEGEEERRRRRLFGIMVPTPKEVKRENEIP